MTRAAFLKRLLLTPVAITMIAVGVFAQESETTPADTTITQDIFLVAGASGRTGRFIVQELAAKGHRVRGLTRDVERAKANVSGDIEWVAGDVRDIESMRAAFEGVTKIICTIGSTQSDGPNSYEFVDYGGVKNLTDLASKNDVEQFVLVSSLGVGGSGLTGWFLSFLLGEALDWKFKGEEHLRASGVPYTILQPGGLEDEPAGQAGITMESLEDGGFGSINRADLAAVSVAALFDPEAIAKTIVINNDQSLAIDEWRTEFGNIAPDS